MDNNFRLVQHTAGTDKQDTGHDWTIYNRAMPFLYEGNGDNPLTLGEAEKLCELLNRAGAWDWAG